MGPSRLWNFSGPIQGWAGIFHGVESARNGHVRLEMRDQILPGPAC